MKILNVVLIFQFLFLTSPLTSSKTYANTCQEGMYFHPRLQRCVLTQEVQDMKHEVRNECEGMTGASLRACHERIANTAADLEGKSADEYKEEVKKGNLARYGLPIIISVLSAYYLLKVKKDSPQCKTGSMWLMIGGAAAALITEITAQKKFKDNIEDLQSEYQTKMNELGTSSEDGEEGPDNAEIMTQGQVMAIDYMIEMEQEKKAVENKRKKGYLIAALAYTSAVGLAIYEQVQAGSMSFGSCSKSDTQAPTQTQSHYTPINNHSNDSFSLEKIVLLSSEMQELTKDYTYLYKIDSDEFYEIVMRKISNFIIPKAHANTIINDVENKKAEIEDLKQNLEDASTVKTAIDGAPQMASKQGNMIDRALRTPYIRAALAGALSAHAWTLHKQAKDNEEESERRINALEDIKLDFTSTGGAGLASYCTEADRKLPSKPGCYCYNKDGSVNKMRKGRDVCIFYSMDKSYRKGEYSKLGGVGYNPMKGCLTSEGKIINNCSYCKIRPKSCELIPAATISGFSIGSVKPYGSTLKSLNDFNDGSLNSSNFDETGIGRQVRAFQKVNKKLSSDPKNKKFMEKVNKLKGQINRAYSKAIKNMPPRTLAAIAGSAQSSAVSSSFQKSLDSKLSEKVKDKLKSKDVTFTAGGEDATAGPSTGADSEFDFGFGDSAAGEGGVEVTDDVADVMDKNYQFNNNDIHKNKGGNIFKILSIRYQRSALIRLFDEKGEYQIDEANKSDINKQ